MPAIRSIEPGFYRIPLPEVLTDSTHGEMRAFELNTVRVRDADGAEGVGYTYTVGRNGGAVDAVLRARARRDPDRRGRRPHRAPVAEGLVGAPLRRPRRTDRARALRLRHGALGPEGAPRRAAAVAPPRRLRPARALLRRRHRPRPAARRAAAPDRRQPRQGLSRHQDEGRAQAALPRTSSACAPCASTSAPTSR